MAGAWREMDRDLSGYITLKELDPEAHDCLLGFKQSAPELPKTSLDTPRTI